jgi:polysaccharide biosynthesis transport protein
MELRRYFNVLLKWWWLILASVAVAASSSLVASLSAPRSYQAHTTLMVGQALQNPNPNSTDLYTGQALAQSYTDLVRREPVLRSTLASLGLDWDWGILQGMVTSRVVPGTQLLEISVLDTDPQRAMVLADELSHQLILQSPASTDSEKEAGGQFIRSQIEDLKANINKGQEGVRQLDSVIAQATSARQAQDARSRQTTLQSQISSWQATYAQLLSTLQQGSTNSLSVVESARMPSSPAGPGTMSNVLVAAAIGLVLSAGAAFLLEYLDDSIKSADDATHILGLPTMGRIAPISGGNYSDKLITILQPRSPISEAYRILRTNLQFSVVDRTLQTVMITSSSPEEGKSLTAANLAVVMAQAGANTLLIDADLRRPTQHEVFDLDNTVGLSLLLSKEPLPLDSVRQNSSIENLKIITSGPLPPNPAELLGSKRMADLLDILKQQNDLIVIDSPPVLAVSDSSALAAHVDTTLLVVDAGRTRRGPAVHSKEALTAIGANLGGVILNRIAQPSGSYAYYYYTDGHRKKKRRLASAFGTLSALFGAHGRFRRQAKSKYPETPAVKAEHPSE